MFFHSYYLSNSRALLCSFYCVVFTVLFLLCCFYCVAFTCVAFTVFCFVVDAVYEKGDVIKACLKCKKDDTLYVRLYLTQNKVLVCINDMLVNEHYAQEGDKDGKQNILPLLLMHEMGA